MATVKGTEIVPARKREIIKKLCCDLCGREAPSPNSFQPWTGDYYDVLEVDVKMRQGVSYPDGGSTETICFDICPECFMEKLVPALEAMGAKPQTEEKDW